MDCLRDPKKKLETNLSLRMNQKIVIQALRLPPGGLKIEQETGQALRTVYWDQYMTLMQNQEKSQNSGALKISATEQSQEYKSLK